MPKCPKEIVGGMVSGLSMSYQTSRISALPSLLIGDEDEKENDRLG